MRREPTWRQPVGMAMILLLIAGWAVIAVTIGEMIETAPWPLLALYYTVAGIIWIFPLKPLLRWMETGHWRRP
ncbi:DUF2842 domain-containing protein [Allosphingosinicella indica]|uniref:DUF2842 domain-containing protein n=1 Tax=Allosphingosinicella indica TaxID=941907 RepID=A0A1X7FXY6_9SPHN|nr:DUF2842 domain-containing protein [Allosphingosinicella indica]SMF60793.1 Protein of unknown function [Allosphingosinicella indica]